MIIYNRYIDYLKDLFNNYQQSETASCTFAIYALYDLSLINKYILIAPFNDTYHLNLNTKPIFEQIIQQIQQLHDSFLHSLLEYISKNIYNKCTNSLSTMKTITSIYRMTNKPGMLSCLFDSRVNSSYRTLFLYFTCFLTSGYFISLIATL